MYCAARTCRAPMATRQSLHRRVQRPDVHIGNSLISHALGDGDGFRTAPDAALQVFPGAHLETEGKIVPGLLTHRAEDLDRELHPCLERAAEFVGALVHCRRDKLPNQIAVATVNLDTIVTGLACAARRLAEVRDDRPDLVQCQFAWPRSEVGAVHRDRRCLSELSTKDGALHEYLTTRFVDRIGHALVARDLLICIDRHQRTSAKDIRKHARCRCKRRDNQTHPPFARSAK